MKFRHILGAALAVIIMAVWAVIFMCICRVRTGQWWMNQGEYK